MASVIVIIIMRFMSFGKNKQTFKYVGGIIAIVFALGFNLLVQGSVSNISDAQLAASLQNSTLPDLFARIFPGIGFASNALLNSPGLSGLWNLLLFMLCSAGAVAVFMITGRLFYFKGVAGVTETSAKRKAIRDISKETEGTSAMKAYFKKEVRLLFRSPTAFLQCVLTTFIWPVLIIIILFSGGSEKFSMMQAAVANISAGLMSAIFAAISAFITSSNAITSTAISREGKGLYYTKYIPMSMRKQLHAKSFTGIIFSSISVVTLIAAVGAFIGINIAVAAISLVLGVIVGAVCSYAGLLIDVANPKLEWINEQQAIKQNMNVIIHLLAGLAFGAIAVIPVAVFGLDIALSALYILVAFALLLTLFIRRVNGKAAEKIIGMDI
jgi:ABC-2 type transport system permease protein